MIDPSEASQDTQPSIGNRMNAVVPDEFFNMKFWLIVCFVSSIWTLIGPFLIAYVYRCWIRGRMRGYWGAVILVGLFSLSLLAFLGSETVKYGPTGLIGGGIVGLICALFVVPNVWSPDCLRFFRRVNGKCPACHTERVSAIRNNEEWQCPACQTTVIWRRSGKIKVNCPNCGATCRGATTEMLGEQAECPICKTGFEIG